MLGKGLGSVRGSSVGDLGTYSTSAENGTVSEPDSTSGKYGLDAACHVGSQESEKDEAAARGRTQASRGSSQVGSRGCVLIRSC